MPNEIRKLVVFANDPLREYYRKGELVDRYFNPCDFFDEIHFISLSEAEIEEEKVRFTAGRARVRIYSIGQAGPWIFFPFSRSRKEALRLIREISPNCIRAYNAHAHGFLAAQISGKLGIPLVVSLHINPEKDIRRFLNPFTDTVKWLFWRINKYLTEPLVLNKADKIICVYSFIYSFAQGLCREKNKLALIYNRIDTERFKPVQRTNRKIDKIKIICVGRLFERKNPEQLIRAMASVDAQLLIIGDGSYRARVNGLIDDLDLSSKVFVIPSVPNEEIHKYYQEADIFVAVTEYGETSKVMLEAMAAGLPIIVSRTKWGHPELLEKTAIIAENSSDGFTRALNYLISNPGVREELGSENRIKASQIDARIMEQKEMEIYRDLLINAA